MVQTWSELDWTPNQVQVWQMTWTELAVQFRVWHIPCLSEPPQTRFKLNPLLMPFTVNLSQKKMNLYWNKTVSILFMNIKANIQKCAKMHKKMHWYDWYLPRLQTLDSTGILCILLIYTFLNFCTHVCLFTLWCTYYALLCHIATLPALQPTFPHLGWLSSASF